MLDEEGRDWDAPGFVRRTAFAFLSFGLLFRSLSGLLKRVLLLTPAERLDVANKITSSVFALIASLYGVRVMAGLSTDAARRFGPYASGYFLYDAVSLRAVHRHLPFAAFVSERRLMLLHHLVLALIIIPPLVRFKHDPPGDLLIGFALLMEASTPFVSARRILAVFKAKDTRLYLINGVLMTIVFIACRAAVLPAFYAFYGRVRGVAPFDAFLRLTPFRCKCCALLVYAPQLYWTALIIRGLVNALQKKRLDAYK